MDFDKLLLALVTTLLIFSCTSSEEFTNNQSEIADLRFGFASIPNDARPRALWDWVDGNFDIEEITLPGFLAAQIAQRVNKVFASSIVHKIKVNSEFDPIAKKFYFSVASEDNTRFQSIYLPIIAHIADKVLLDYKFEEFSEIIIRNELLRNFVLITKSNREEYRNVDIDEIVTLPFFN